MNAAYMLGRILLPLVALGLLSLATTIFQRFRARLDKAT